MNDANDSQKPEDTSADALNAQIEIGIEIDQETSKAFSEAVVGGATALHSFLGVLQGALKGAETAARKSPDTEGLAHFFKDAANDIKQARAHIRSEIKAAQQDASPKAAKKGPAQP